MSSSVDNPPQIAPGDASALPRSPTPAPGPLAPATQQSATLATAPVRSLGPIHDATRARRADGYRVPHDTLTKQTAQMLYLQGIAVTRIAASVNVPVETVRKWATRGRWPEMRAALQAQTQQHALAVVQQGLSSVSRTLRADLAGELQAQADALKKLPVKSARDLASNKHREGRARVVKTIAEAASIVCGWEDEAKVGLIVPMVDAPPPAVDVEASVLGDEPPADEPSPISGAVPDLPAGAP